MGGELTLSEPETAASGTCVEAETFALRVLDDSMQPEFRRGCIIIIDPTGRATDGSYVLAKNVLAKNALEKNSLAKTASDNTPTEPDEEYIFRQLRRVEDGLAAEPTPAISPELNEFPPQWQLVPLNDHYSLQSTPSDLSAIVGVIVQRAGIRRRYHKHYY